MSVRALVVAVLLAFGQEAGKTAGPAVDFGRDVRPILSDACFICHGPDPAKRKAKLRLDTRDGAFAEHDGSRAVVPGNLDKSELYRRIVTADPDDRMPPAKAGRALTPAQVDIIRRWILQGAPWGDHWAFVRPTRPAPPPVSRPGWGRTPIDAFVLARLDREGLSPSPEADRATLLRRVTLDLTGLPPTPAEVDAFLADPAPDAYEKVVDRLLASPRYGERMAFRWLEGARYADTSGYQNDGPRDMWRWRDWVIDAFNRNVPFDRFTVEQIAGDLLPGATLDQRIATGFNRNHRGNSEGGIIPEEYQVEYVVDRVDTTATVWLGLTMGCARCHDHKYDPVTQREFYRIFAYFNNVPEHGRAIKEGNSPPFIPAPTPEQQQELARLEAAAAEAEREVRALDGRLEASQRAWEAAGAGDPPDPWTITRGMTARRPGTAFDGSAPVDLGKVAAFGYRDKFSLIARVRPAGTAGGTLMSKMVRGPHGDGYSVHLEEGRIQVNLVKRWLDDALRVETERPLAPDRWAHVAVTYDGSRGAAGVSVYVDGNPEKLVVRLDALNQNITTDEPFRVGDGIRPFRGLLEDVRVYSRRLSPDEVGILSSPEGAAARRARYLDTHAPEEIRAAARRLVETREKAAAYRESLPTVMVMEEMHPPRETRLLLRGQYDKPGEKVTPGVPASLHPLGPVGPNDRLAFARWLVDPANPLTARVAVNRWWQMSFGEGLVRTVEDFGVQGQPPTHPELLDWLAVDFMESGWDVRRLRKLIVTSSAYRQSSRPSPELLEKDPENRLLSRAPRLRLPAEMVRDQALAASGLLVEKVGGPSVKPYQPAGLWNDIATDTAYEPSHGADLYRRSLYAYWKRTVGPPALTTFDAPMRDACTVRQTRTNTPLQALALLNDVTYVEAARALAERMMTEGGREPASRLSAGFLRVLGRRPRPEEEAIFLAAIARRSEAYRADPAKARRLITAGESAPDPRLDPAELAATTVAASMILNLDEAVTRE